MTLGNDTLPVSTGVRVTGGACPEPKDPIRQGEDARLSINRFPTNGFPTGGFSADG